MKFPTAVILISLSQLAFGQQQMPAMPPRSSPLTLEQIEAVAMVGNPEIRTAVRRVSVAQTRVPGAGALDDPMFMYRDWGTPLNRPYDLNQAQNMFMLQQTFAGPGKRAARSDVAGKEVEVAKEQLEATRRDVQARVRKSFYDLMRNADELRVHDEQMQLTKQALGSATVKYTVGRVPQQDVLKAQIAITRLEEHLIMLEEQGEMARASLNTLMGRDPSTPLEIAGRYSTVAHIPSLAKLEQIAVENRPELRAYAAQQKVAEARANLAGKAYTPDYTVAAGYMLMPAGSMTRNNYMAELTVNLPWLNRRKHDSEIAEAKAMTETTNAEYEMRRSAVSLEIQEALIKVRSAQRALELYRDTLRPQAEATFRSAAAAYQHDRTDFLNLIDSQNMMLDVQSSFYRTAAELDSRLADLERAIGAAVPREEAGNGVRQ
ncbi:MAG TPA: TolC family protein [Terriglobales bacterium]|nr:TolC family protein [Terriglobales bacterium]